jgi:hypothetical protein
MQLARVANPKGRIDVALYRIAEKLMGRFEEECRLVGVRENLLPLLEQVIIEYTPQRNILPTELEAIYRVIQQNTRRM